MGLTHIGEPANLFHQLGLEVSTLVAMNPAREPIMCYEVVVEGMCSGLGSLISCWDGDSITSEVICDDQDVSIPTLREF